MVLFGPEGSDASGFKRPQAASHSQMSDEQEWNCIDFGDISSPKYYAEKSQPAILLTASAYSRSVAEPFSLELSRGSGRVDTGCIASGKSSISSADIVVLRFARNQAPSVGEYAFSMLWSPDFSRSDIHFGYVCMLLENAGVKRVISHTVLVGSRKSFVLPKVKVLARLLDEESSTSLFNTASSSFSFTLYVKPLTVCCSTWKLINSIARSPISRIIMMQLMEKSCHIN